MQVEKCASGRGIYANVCSLRQALRHCAFTVNPHRPVSPSAGHQPGYNSLGGVECTAHHPGSRGVADIVSVTMPLLSIKDLAVAISTRAGPAEDDPPLYK